MRTSNTLLHCCVIGSALVSAACSSGCGKALPTTPKITAGGASTNVSITSSGGLRSYLIHIPANYDVNNPVPLYLSYHGRGKDAANQEGLSQFSNPMFNPNGIAVYPQGQLYHGTTHQWQGDPAADQTVSDVQFTSDLIDHLLDRYCIDPTKVFSAGKSNGAGLQYYLACDDRTANKIAAFAPVSAALYTDANGNLPTCNSTRTEIPLMEFHGWVDTTIRYLGGPQGSDRGPTINVKSFVDSWAVKDGCQASDAVVEQLCTDTNVVTHYTWNCNGIDGIVQHYNISNLGHDWPSTNGNSDSETLTTCFNATAKIMDFFGQHPLPQ